MIGERCLDGRAWRSNGRRRRRVRLHEQVKTVGE